MEPSALEPPVPSLPFVPSSGVLPERCSNTCCVPIFLVVPQFLVAVATILQFLVLHT